MTFNAPVYDFYEVAGFLNLLFQIPGSICLPLMLLSQAEGRRARDFPVSFRFLNKHFLSVRNFCLVWVAGASKITAAARSKEINLESHM